MQAGPRALTLLSEAFNLQLRQKSPLGPPRLGHKAHTHQPSYYPYQPRIFQREAVTCPNHP